MFETPFTRRGPDGKVSHGDMSCQWKVKTILTTEACFPYLKTRIKVVARENLELTPIQVLAWLRDCWGPSHCTNGSWPAYSGFNWRSWAQIGEVGNCLRPTCKSDNAPGSCGPIMIESYEYEALLLFCKFNGVNVKAMVRIMSVLADGTSKLCGNCCQCWTFAHCWCLPEEARPWLSFSSADEGGSSKALGSMS